MAHAEKHPAIGRPVNEEARALRRDQILAGARACFVRKGFHAASTAEISAEARVSVANLYQYFQTKDDLVRALIDQDLAGDLALVEAVDAADSFQQGLEVANRLLASDVDIMQDSCLRLEILAEASRNPAIAAVVKTADDQLVRALSALIVRYQAKGELSGEVVPETAARLIVALYDGLFCRFAFGIGDSESLIAAADSFVFQALAAVGAPARHIA